MKSASIKAVKKEDIITKQIDINDSDVKISLQLFICRGLEGRKPIFIFCGRKERALIPQIDKRADLNCEVILVLTREEYGFIEEDGLKKYLQPGISILLIENLWAKTHGQYEPGLITTRRLAAFIAALHLNMPNALMLDDNIQSIHTSSSFSWDTLFESLVSHLKEQNTFCTSIATISNNTHKREDNELGSKCFMLDTGALKENLGVEPRNLFLLFYPEKGQHIWGEDYFFQIILHYLNDAKRGFAILDQSKFGLKRSAQARSICRDRVASADAVLQLTFYELYPNYTSLPPMHLSLLEKSFSQFQALIKEHIENHEKAIHNSKTKSLMIAHAIANRILRGNFPCFPEQKPLSSSQWTEELKHQIGESSKLTDLYPYQKNIFQKISTDWKDGQNIRIEMPTGTGKTYVQIFLAISALKTRTTSPIIIVTPFRNLVQQFYEDFLSALKAKEVEDIYPEQVIKVDSSKASVGAKTLLGNNTLDNRPFIYIFCTDSFKEVLGCPRFRDAQMLIFDESHLQHEVLHERLKEKAQGQVIIDLSATPSPMRDYPGLEIKYSRIDAVRQNYITPFILDRLPLEYSESNLLLAIKNMPKLLKERLFPTGKTLLEHKGIIYVPNDDATNNILKCLNLCSEIAE